MAEYGRAQRARRPLRQFPARSAACPTNSSVAQERDPPGASGAGDVLELLQLFYSFLSRNLVWKMLTYSRDVPVGTLRTVRGARARERNRL